MIISRRPFIVALGTGVLAAVLTAAAQQAAAPLGSLVLPAGFQADVFADKVENAREMVLAPGGTVFVGSRTAGKVHAVVDKNGDCWVANRTQGNFRPSVTQIVTTGGIDRNLNSIIDTSTDLNSNGQIDPTEILPWGQDERIIRHDALGSVLGNPARGMTLDKTGFLWIGLTTSMQLIKVSPSLSTVTYSPTNPPTVAPSPSAPWSPPPI